MAVLCALGVPCGTEVGLDGQLWAVGARFQGVRDIPPGLHFLCHGAGHGTRQGEWLELEAGTVCVRVWDTGLEALAPATADAAARVAAALRRGELGAGLGPYPAARGDAWRLLTQHVTPASLLRAGLPLGVPVGPGAADEGPPDEEAVAAAPQPGAPVTPRFPGLAARRLAGMSARDVTAFNTRPGLRLERVLAEAYGGCVSSYLADWQAAFVLFLLLSSLPSLEHWKAGLHLVSDACAAASRAEAPHWARLAAAVAAALPAQLSLALPQLLADPEVDTASFLHVALQQLARAGREPDAPPALRTAGAHLQEYLDDAGGEDAAQRGVGEGDDDDDAAGALIVDDDSPRAGADGAVVDDGDGGAGDGAGAVEAGGGEASQDMGFGVPLQRMSWMEPPSS